MRLVLPRLYVILDAALIPSAERDCAESLAEAGVRLVQYRNKSASAGAYLESCRGLAETLRAHRVAFFVNDRPDVALLAGAGGVHVGQQDLDVEQARRVVGRDKLVGVSTHNLEQFERAARSSVDYIALGPIYSTATKARPDPVVGLDFLRQVRGLTDKPVVAIGGISLGRAAAAIEAGADSVAVISGILSAGDPGQRARQYIETLEAAKPGGGGLRRPAHG
jgi:thiamine-phosphate pyrophosphorylase